MTDIYRLSESLAQKHNTYLPTPHTYFGVDHLDITRDIRIYIYIRLVRLSRLY